MRSNFHRRGGRFSSFTTTLLYCAQSRGFGYRILPFGSLLELMQIVTLPSAPELLSPATTETETGDWRQWCQDKLCQLLDLQLESFKCQGIKSFRIGWDGMQWSGIHTRLYSSQYGIQFLKSETRFLYRTYVSFSRFNGTFPQTTEMLSMWCFKSLLNTFRDGEVINRWLIFPEKLAYWCNSFRQVDSIVWIVRIE